MCVPVTYNCLTYIRCLDKFCTTSKCIFSGICFELERISLATLQIRPVTSLKKDMLLKTVLASFLHYTGYLNFIHGPISRVSLLIPVHVQLLSCLFF